ncbi:MAG: ABC transporter ATP-binding protein [Pseudomonadota bacterium]
MPGALLTAERLSLDFLSAGQRVPVIDNLTFSVDPGESLAVVGRSGSGKSTLLNLLCGLRTPDHGVIAIGNESFGNAGDAGSVARWAELRRQFIGVVFQQANLMPALSLVDNVRLRTYLAGRQKHDERWWLQRLGVGDQADRYPDRVSGGQAQRAALAMVFAMAPSLILADEPTGSLDRHTADEVADSLFNVQLETGCALVLATHDSELAARCGRVLDLSATG